MTWRRWESCWKCRRIVRADDICHVDWREWAGAVVVWVFSLALLIVGGMACSDRCDPGPAWESMARSVGCMSGWNSGQTCDCKIECDDGRPRMACSFGPLPPPPEDYDLIRVDSTGVLLVQCDPNGVVLRQGVEVEMAPKQ